MNEQQKTQEVKNFSSDTNSNTGDNPQAQTILEQANAIRQGLERENQRYEENLRRHEELVAKRALGGMSDGPTPEGKREETAKEFKEKFMRGELKFPTD